MMIEQVHIAGVNVQLVRKSVKFVRLSVRPPHGQVRISAPWRVSQASLETIVREKLAWIRHHQETIAARPHPKLLQYIEGENHIFFGQVYPLRIFPRSRRSVSIEVVTGQLHMYTPIKHDATMLRRGLESWYRKQLAGRILAYIEKWQPRMGVEVKTWGIKRMKTRWGTCNTRSQRIWINFELVKRPERCLEYIVVHEMVHLLERSHNQRFKNFMSEFLPDWRTINQELKQQLP